MTSTDASASGADDRKVLMNLGVGQVAALSADADDPLWPVPRELRAFNEPTFTNQGRMLPEDAAAYIPIVQRRLNLTEQLLRDLPGLISEQSAIIDRVNAQIDLAYARVRQLVITDHQLAMERSQTPTGYIVTAAPTIAAEAWLASRSAFLRDTPEWRAYEQLSQRARGERSPRTVATTERTRLETVLRQERILRSSLPSRLFDLNECVTWWSSHADEPLPVT